MKGETSTTTIASSATAVEVLDVTAKTATTAAMNPSVGSGVVVQIVVSVTVGESEVEIGIGETIGTAGVERHGPQSLGCEEDLHV